MRRLVVTHGGDVFAVAREQGWNWQDVLDFSANMNPLGPSALVKPALVKALDRIVHYPEREPERLRSALAEAWGLESAQVLLGNGATELIYFAARLFREVQVTVALPAFSEFHRAFPEAGEADLTEASTWPADGLLVLTRPANPTGWSVPLETIQGFLERSKATVLVDESFLEFSGLSSAAALMAHYSRVIVLRSLTKFYALPGLRLGALVSESAVVESWRTQREPWQVNVLAEEAALAALQDKGHATRSIHFVREERGWLFQQLQALRNVRPVRSDANFLFARLGCSAASLSNHMRQRKILIRDCAGWPGMAGEAVRVAVRKREDNERLLAAWRDFPCA